MLASVFAYDGDFSGWNRLGPVLLAVIPAVLMASSFRFASFRWIASPRPDKVWVTVAIVLALLAGLVLVPVGALLVVAYTYLLLPPLGWASAPLRRRWFGEDSVAPPRRRVPSVFFLANDADEPSRS